ncbi:MAG TPA: class I SAM-dependent methyltransferase [Acidimicrobiales bacterium]|nr:class I SAM-dependent methyltransferase [Acidimicrobiales bacterium]
MERHEFLTVVHERYKPRSYLEIGINDGLGLARSTTRTIGVDPDFCISVELACDLELVKATSDDFFARSDAISWFPEGLVDFTFIDGLHLFEVALRDFMNAERLSAPTSVIVLDDVLPRSVSEAARQQHTFLWAGDTYKVTAVLERYRPDLTVVPLDTEPTGMLLVVGLDPTNTVLGDHYDEIVAQYATADPQPVPDEVLQRRGAADPERVADSPAWGELARARDTGGPVPPMDDLRS